MHRGETNTAHGLARPVYTIIQLCQEANTIKVVSTMCWQMHFETYCKSSVEGCATTERCWGKHLAWRQGSMPQKLFSCIEQRCGVWGAGWEVGWLSDVFCLFFRCLRFLPVFWCFFCSDTSEMTRRVNVFCLKNNYCQATATTHGMFAGIPGNFH